MNEDAINAVPVSPGRPVHSNSPTIPAPRDSAEYGADRALASRLHALADVVALRGRPAPTRVPGLPRVLVVPRVVHDLICRVRVATPQDTVPPVSHCAACGLAMPMDGPAPAEEPVERVDQDDQDDVVPLRVLLDAAAESMSGLTAAALRPMFGLLASVAYRAGRGDAHATDAAGQIGGVLAELSGLADTGRPVPDDLSTARARELARALTVAADQADGR